MTIESNVEPDKVDRQYTEIAHRLQSEPVVITKRDIQLAEQFEQESPMTIESSVKPEGKPDKTVQEFVEVVQRLQAQDVPITEQQERRADEINRQYPG